MKAILIKKNELFTDSTPDIKAVLLFFPSWLLYPEIRENDKTEVKKFLNAYKNIIQSIHHSININLVTHKIAKPKIENFVTTFPNKTTIILVDNEIDFSLWTQDVFCVGIQNNERYILQPSNFNRENDDQLARILSKKLRIKHRQLNFFFEAGNILVGDNFWFVGGNDVMCRNARNEIELNKEAIHNFKQELDSTRTLIPIYSTKKIKEESTKEIIINGTAWKEAKNNGNRKNCVQPIFHIDMFITLIGRDSKGVFTVLVGDSNMTNFGISDEKISPHLSHVLDDIANDLVSKKFNVIRNPLPYLKIDDKKKQTRNWYFATYNNVFIQHEIMKVTLPTYCTKNHAYMKEVDDYNISLWQSLGFKVKKIKYFHRFSKNYGAINCIVKVID